MHILAFFYSVTELPIELHRDSLNSRSVTTLTCMSMGGCDVTNLPLCITVPLFTVMYNMVPFFVFSGITVNY